MFKQYYNVVGVMSGTSLDGVDLAHVEFFYKNNKWNFNLKSCETVSYDDLWVKKLKEGLFYNEKELIQLNEDYTNLLATIITSFISKNTIESLDAVCSHGHTIKHEPQNNYTLQIGNLPKIAKLINQKVVCDFRVQDVNLGGQGAPLVPIGDKLLFAQYDYCLNLGGFSNISFDNEKNERIAYDISPVNTVLNYYANKLGFDYDDAGKIAASGTVNQNLLNELNQNAFYSNKYPKSLGIEFVNKEVFPVINQYKIDSKDILATYTSHIGFQISKNITKKNTKILITGGGSYNLFLIKNIQQFNTNINLYIPEKKIIEFKEAIIFGFLGVLKLENQINVLCSVTGASKNHSTGVIFS